MTSSYGQGGRDRLVGDADNDRLNGGEGKDYLYGGTGLDYFDWDVTAKSTLVGGNRDIVADFVQGDDKFDLSGIDANTTLAGNQAFTFSGGPSFSGAAGSLYVWYFTAEAPASSAATPMATASPISRCRSSARPLWSRRILSCST